MDRALRTLAALAALLACHPAAAAAQCFVPTPEIVSGGPGKDGIPALNEPRAVSAADAEAFLRPDDLVLGVVAGGAARAYPYGTYDRADNTQLLFPQGSIDERRPLKELVLGLTEASVDRAYPYPPLGERVAINDVLAGRPVLVVLDDGERMALPFDRRVGDRLLSFQAEPGPFPFLLRDLETESLWDLTGHAVSGDLAGARLTPIAAYSAMWFAWASFHPGTEIFPPPQAAPPSEKSLAEEESR